MIIFLEGQIITDNLEYKVNITWDKDSIRLSLGKKHLIERCINTFESEQRLGRIEGN
jgi:hypothetical protein